MDIDFLRIDFDPCERTDKSKSHKFSGIARCKSTTRCEPLPGFGFRRGGYICHCRPGYRYPFYQNGPFKGVDIEQATAEEYDRGFDCLPVGWRQEQPTEKGIGGSGKGANPNSRKRRSAAMTKYEQFMTNVLRREKGLNPKYFNEPAWKHRGKNKSSKTDLTFMQHVKLAASKHWERAKTKLHCGWHYLRHGAKAVHSKAVASKKRLNDLLFKPNKFKSAHPGSHSTADSLVAKTAHPKILARQKRGLDYLGKMSSFNQARFEQVRKLFVYMNTISKGNCKSKRPDELRFVGEVGYGADKEFEGAARTALRLAHFLSAFMQNTNEDEHYGNLRGDRPINRHQVFGEVFANIMADTDIETSGVFFDRDKFVENLGNLQKKRQWFAPYAYRLGNSAKSTTGYEAMDYAGEGKYWTEPWFQHQKDRWASNTYGLERFVDKPYVRSDVEGTQFRKYDNFPLYYRAPRYEDGYWSEPYFDCGGKVNDWVITYSAPFFGKSDAGDALQFMGIVAVTMKLRNLDVNQCPASFYTPNFFKSTARCDFESTYCVQIPGRDFAFGGYKCECRQGYEYPFNDQQAWFFDGQTMEEEWNKKRNGLANRFDILKCREAGAASLLASLSLLTVTVLMSLSRYL